MEAKPLKETIKYYKFLGLCIFLLAPSLVYANMDDPESDDTTFSAALDEINNEQWHKAIEILKSIERDDPQNADLHNYLGYSYRKRGKIEKALKHYKKSIELNPEHKNAHEYIGEAYLLVNDLESASKHLQMLKNLCSPTPCEQVVQLEKAVEEFKKQK